MKSLNPTNLNCIDCSNVSNSIPDCPKATQYSFNGKGAGRYLLILVLSIFLSGFYFQSNAQSSTCVPGMVMNSNSSLWSEECYLNSSCQEQGNPCSSNDVRLLGVYIADMNGNPVPACDIGETQTVLLWGRFNNNTGTNRYAIRTRTEVWINGVFNVELNACSFDVLPSGATNAALLGSFTYTCGDQIQLLNTWVAWETSAGNCATVFDCGDYSPSKCSKELGFIDFLTVNFDYSCGNSTSTTTEVCFTDLTLGGTPPYSYAWTFGDGGTSTMANPCHTYNATTGTFTATLYVTDADGITAGAFENLDLANLICCNLTFTCPPMVNPVLSCPSQVPAANPNLVVVTDSCGPVTITVSNVTTGSGCGTDTMRVRRRYLINDGTSLDSCIQIFRVIDKVPPSISCPAAVTVQCSALVPPRTPGSITATDNCAGALGPTVTFVSDVTTNMTCTNRLTLTRTYRATDACGNSATCAQTITVFDNTVPTIACPAGVTVQCASLVPPANPGGITATGDNCGGTVTVSVLPDITTNQTCINRLTLTRVYRATDLCGNSATCAQTITVFDNTLPTIACPAGVTVQCASLVPPANPGGITATGDNCGGKVTVSVLPDITT
ncbi:MAG: PKD domain-containing protein, partial [Bacteroidota bacterium]|nr:PKD domain-containing protein [Bacteroidota bacterium]